MVVGAKAFQLGPLAPTIEVLAIDDWAMERREIDQRGR